ncbi:MAG: sigma-70 family RNA polymerase sigma factor [Leptospiraceae bacterium]|nr:sigma-70 family RNA polymerase sigma factor [Leptospiraceae bacterium]
MRIEEFEAFYEQNKDSVFGYLQSGLRDADTANDVLQDVFLKILEKVRQGQIQAETARAYAFRVARNALIDEIRSRNRNDELVNPDDLIYHSERDKSETIRILFRDALVELPGDIAAILELRLLDHKPVEEICKVLDTSRATLYRKMEQGLTSVAAYFRKHGFDLEGLEV